MLCDGAMRAFSELLLPQHLLLALREAGYERPSPVQARVQLSPFKATVSCFATSDEQLCL